MKFKKMEIIPWHIFNELLRVYIVLKHNMLYKYDKTDFLSLFPTNAYDKVLQLLFVEQSWLEIFMFCSNCTFQIIFFILSSQVDKVSPLQCITHQQVISIVIKLHAHRLTSYLMMTLSWKTSTKKVKWGFQIFI